jgi:LuxR family maltose regulon positive regulatory protein
VARLRARDQLTEIRERDLRFTPQEAAIFLKQMNLDLSEEDGHVVQSDHTGAAALAAAQSDEQKHHAHYV